MSSTYRIRLFGVPGVEHAERVAPIAAPPKALALLGYLARHPGPVPRSQLAALLWSETTDTRSRRNLTHTLGQIAAILPGCLEPTSRAVRWDPACAWADVHAWPALSDQPDTRPAPVSTEQLDGLEQAVNLYRGEFLAGLALAGCPEFETWLVREREHWRQHMIAALTTLVRHYAHAQQYAVAEPYARRLIALDPWHEDGHRALLLLLAYSDRRGEALAHYERLQRLLAAELGIAPSDETRALAERIRAGTATRAVGEPPPAPRPGAPPPAPRADWGDAPPAGRLYGRAAELAALQSLVAARGCRLVAVLGMGGLGKTRLAAHFARTQAVPFAAIIWRSLLNAPPLPELLRSLIGALSVEPPPAAEGLDTQLDLLLELLAGQRCLLILDNYESLLQPGERASVYRPGYEPYHQLLRRIAVGAHQSCLVLTSREQPQGYELLEAEAPAVCQLRLPGLAADACHALLRACGLQLPAQHAALLARHYSGSPLALQIVAETVKEIFGGDLELFLQETALIFDDIRAVLDQQWARLTPLERTVMCWLAIARAPLSSAQLFQQLIGGVARSALVDALRSLSRRSLIESHQGSFALQNVVLEYVTDQLIDQICTEIVTGAPEHIHTHGLMRAQDREHIRASQVRMILQPIAERLVAQLGRDELKRRLQLVLAWQRAARPRVASYLAGNVLNLLLLLGYDLRGASFAQLSVWQADLSGAWLPEVDFSEADLSGSIFTDSVRGVEEVAFSPDGALVAVARSDGEVRMWQADRGQLVGSCSGHRGVVWSLCFSPDGRRLASGGEDASIRLWDVATRRCLAVLSGHATPVSHVAWSPDGTLLASAGGWDKTVRLWDPQDGRAITTLTMNRRFAAKVAWSPDSTRLATSDAGGAIQIWERTDWRCARTIDGAGLAGPLGFSPDGTRLAGAIQRAVRLWDVRTGALIRHIDTQGPPVHALAWSPARPILALGVARDVWLWDAGADHFHTILHGHVDGIRSLAWSGDGTQLATWGDETLRIWSAAGEPQRIIRGHKSAVFSVAVSADGSRVAAGYASGRIQIWDAHGWQEGPVLHGHSGVVNRIALSADGTTLVSASSDQRVGVWDVRSGRLRHMFVGHTAAVRALALHPDGDLLATGGEDSVIRLWHITEGRLDHVLAEHQGHVLDLAFLPGGTRLVSCGDDSPTQLWALTQGGAWVLAGRYPARAAVIACSPAGQQLASAVWEGDIRLWDAESGTQRRSITHVGPGLTRLAFSPDGRSLLGCGHDEAVWIWDAAAGSVRQRLAGHVGWVQDVGWMPDGVTILSGGRDGTVRLWSGATGQMLRVLAAPAPYAGMRITGATGLSEAQRAVLRALGAVE